MTDTTRTLVAVFTLLAGLIAISAWRSPNPSNATPRAEGIRTGVDPNTAPWWELTALPGIGESTARNIIAYRDAHPGPRPVFRRPLDLEPVPDVGRMTIQRITPHLRFETANPR